MTDSVIPGINDCVAAYQEAMCTWFNRTNLTVEPFALGAVIMWKDTCRSSKTKPICLGPGKILQQTRGSSYIIQDADGHLLPANKLASHLRLVNSDELPQDCCCDEPPR